MNTSNFCMKVERSNFILVPNSAQSTNVFLQSKCNMHDWYGHVSWSWRSYITQLEPSSEPGQLINYARFWPHRWTFAKNRTAHAQTHYRKSTQWQWASFVSVVSTQYGSGQLNLYRPTYKDFDSLTLLIDYCRPNWKECASLTINTR